MSKSSKIYKQPKRRPRKQTTNWTDDENNALVHEVKKYECIWNPVHQDYRSGKLRKKIWKKIQGVRSLVARNSNECCDRWGVLRVVYKVE